MSVFFEYVAPILMDLTVRRDPAVTVDLSLGSVGGQATAVVEEMPTLGAIVDIYDPATLTKLTRGSLVRRRQIFREGDLAYETSIQNPLFLLNRRYPFGSWTSTLLDPISATTIVQEIFDNYTDGFTLFVDEDLPPISINFVGLTTFADCLTAICNAVAENDDNEPIGWTVTPDFVVRVGADASIQEYTDNFSGNGSQTVFPLTKHLVLTPGSGALGRGYVTYDNGGGPVNETLSFTGGGGTWEYDSGSNNITRTSGAPVSGTDNIQIIYSYDDDAVEDITDSSVLLVRDPAPSLESDITQIRNRIIVYGVGTTTLTDSSSFFTVISIADAVPFSDGCSVLIGGRIHLVDTVQRGEIAGIPSTLFIPATLGVEVAAGSPVRLVVQVDDVSSQNALALVEGGDGVHEFPIAYDDWTISPEIPATSGPGGGYTDERSLAEIASLTAIANAEKIQWSTAQDTVEYETYDHKTRPGKRVTFNLTNPPIVGTFKIQTVRVYQINVAPNQENGTQPPRFHATAGRVRFDINDLLQRVLLSSPSGSTSSGAPSGGGGGGGGGGGPVTFEYAEEATGAINGSNTVFTVVHPYITGSLRVYLNGVLQDLGDDYTETDTDEFTMVVAPTTGDKLTAVYKSLE